MAPGHTFAVERRRRSRRVPASGEPLARIRLRTGGEAAVLDLSNNGALIEGGSRLLPNTHVDVHLVTRDGRVLARSRVLRAFVSELRSDHVRYRAALAFESDVDTTAHGYPVPDPLSRFAVLLGNAYPAPSATAGTRDDENLSE